MDVNIDIDTLRRKHKTELVERAFRLFAPNDKGQEAKSYWLERLVEGHDVRQMLDCLKHDWPMPVDAFSSLKKGGEEDSPIGRIRIIDDNLVLHAGLKRKLLVSLKNSSDKIFVTNPEEPVFVAYHWYLADGEVYEFDGIRTPLPKPVEPGQQIEMLINLTPPAEPGDYQLMVTMVHEGRYWMEDMGVDVQRQSCVVQDYDGRGLTRHALSVFKQLQAAELESIH